jgi:hypothetical protein
MSGALHEASRFLVQARADLRASECPDLPACHRRYWIQQCCEKAVKALGISLWSKPLGKPREADHEFTRRFRLEHSPLAGLDEATKAPGSHLKAFKRLLMGELRDFPELAALLKVDALAQSANSEKPSLRYPFVDRTTGEWVAPVEWDESDWDRLIGGPESQHRQAASRLVGHIETHLRRVRGP